MTYVENKRKELQTDYYESPKQVGKEQTLLPQGLLGLKGNVLKRHRVGIG